MNTPKIDLRLRHTCPHCRALGRPLLRVYGYPADEKLFVWESQGRIRLAGCCIPTPIVNYECRHCGADWPIRQAEFETGTFCPPGSPRQP